jgi:hypothetical protein
MIKRKRNNNGTGTPYKIQRLGNPTFEIVRQVSTPINGEHYLYTYDIRLTQDALLYFKNIIFTQSTNIQKELSGEVLMYEDASVLHEGTRRSVDLPAVLMSYHVHPGPAALYGLQNTSTFITHPSMEDITAYILNFPTTQVNFILDINGIFIVDVIRTLVDIKTGALSKDGILRQIRHDTGENLMNTNNKNALDLYLDYVKKVYNEVLLLKGPHIVLNGTYYYRDTDISHQLAQFVAKTGIQIIYIPYSTVNTPTFQINTVAPLPIKKLQRYIRNNAL